MTKRLICSYFVYFTLLYNSPLNFLQKKSQENMFDNERDVESVLCLVYLVRGGG